MCGRIEKRVIEARNNKKKEVKLMEHNEKQEPTDIKEAKRALRRQIRSQAPAMSDELRRTKGRLLAEAVMSLPEFVRAHSIIAFWPLADEINAAILLTMAQRAGKKTYLPVMQGNSLVFREYTDYHCLSREPHYGICEPNETMKTLDTEAMKGEGIFMVIPGVAFSADGGRLGRGRGFYDRAIEQLPEATRVGVCYLHQMTDSVPRETHDALMHHVLAF